HPRHDSLLLPLHVQHLFSPIYHFPFHRQRLAYPQPAVSEETNHVGNLVFTTATKPVFDLLQPVRAWRDFAAVSHFRGTSVTAASRQRIRRQNTTPDS